ncbi:ATP-binding protein [Novosphingobium sp. SG707]|uniref:AAA family ATPase n=1 Tax=Novosphingobium sp. SG707 TaxID=2586996 RepID=UPI00144855C6|nr:ATP-binding protein [Novosphingobium sp. SG707]NKJ02791.1 putative ATPase [Novosphingobium sp. SG707]
MLDLFGLSSLAGTQEGVAILVGPNGSGKSNLLRKLAGDITERRNVIIICNTAYDRFAEMRGVIRFSAGRSSNSPQNVIKRAVAETADNNDSRYYQIKNILEYCGYRPKFGFRFRINSYFPLLIDQIGPVRGDLATAIDLLRTHSSDDILWIDPAEPFLAHARTYDFVSVLRRERELIKYAVLDGIDVCLQMQDGEVIELKHASSGQLSLIASFVFLIVNASESPIVIIDEPENSLHPNWQREYVDKLLAAMSYRNGKIVIATHSPLIVTGAITGNSDIISVYQVCDGEPTPLGDKGRLAPSSGIEELLWKAFDIVTPASHFVSVEVLDEIARFERDEISKEGLLDLIERMERRSFDDRQRAFFDGVRQLVDKVASSNASARREP